MRSPKSNKLRRSYGGVIVEYVLLLGLVFFTCTIAFHQYGEKIEDKYSEVGNELGRGPSGYNSPTGGGSGENENGGAGGKPGKGPPNGLIPNSGSTQPGNGPVGGGYLEEEKKQEQPTAAF